MHRIRGLAAVASLLALSLAGCNEDGSPVHGTIGGQVSIEGTGIDGVVVTLSNGATTSTTGGGTFIFRDIEGGIYNVVISGYPGDAVFNYTSMPALILAEGHTANVVFTGTYIRTSGVRGRVTAEGTGIGGVTVRLSGTSNATAFTAPNGEYSLTNLRAGNYTLEISDFDAGDIAFSITRQSFSLQQHESRIASFDARYLRTGRITGRVSVSGEGLQGVAVNLAGPAGRTASTTTDAGGIYTFAELRSGEYGLDISGYDAGAYEFAVTAKSVILAGGETANVPFDGVRLRTAGVRGRVSADGVGLDGVTVILSGAADDTTATADDGRYRFADLGPGTYRVAITGYDASTYSFEAQQSPAFTLERGESTDIDFAGTASRTASIVGYLYVDENPKNDAFDPGSEDLLPHAGFPVILQGPGTTDVRAGLTDADGRYAFLHLKGGNYRVVPELTPDAVDSLGALGYAYGGPPLGMSVELAGGTTAEVYLPTDITHQTIAVTAVLGAGDRRGPLVEGVQVDLYGTLADADAQRDPLGTAATDSAGTATITFPRTEESDQLVFTRVSALPHESLEVTAHERMGITYPLRYQTTPAPDTVTIVNRRADLRFSARTIETARGGAAPLAGWEAAYTGGTTPVVADTLDEDGEAVFHLLPAAADLPARLTVGLAADQPLALGESFAQTPLPSEQADSSAGRLTYIHDGLALPGDTVDLGEIELRFTTQSLVVGVHWERDERPGYTTDGVYGDKRPNRSRPDIDITVVVRDEQGHPRPWRNDDPNHDINVNGHPRNPGPDGLVVFRNLPADTEFIVDADIGPNRVLTSRGVADTWRDFGQFDVGAFGAAGGGTPEVRMCGISTVYGRADCSTFAYVWTNGEVWGWVGSADYGGTPTPNDTIADRFGVSAPDVFANGLVVTLTYQGRLFSYDESTVVGLSTDDGEYLVGDGEFRFTDVPNGGYTLSVTGDDEWGSRTLSFPLIEDEDTEDGDSTTATGAMKALSVTLPYLKTSISGTVANDTDGDGQADPLETAAGIELELLRVQGSDTVATGQSDTTTVLGAFSFDPIVEGAYVVKASSDDYFVAGTNTVPIDRSPVLTTDARPANRVIASGDALPVWDYATSLIDADAGQSGVQSDVADFTDADFIVLFGTGSMSGKVTRPDDGSTTDTDTDPDPFAGLAVHVQHCEAAVGSTRCQAGRLGTQIQATTRRDGSWEAQGLREGYHQVTVSFPADSWEYGALPGTTEPRTSYFEQLAGTDATRDSLDFHLVPRRGGTARDGGLVGRVTRNDDGSATDTNNDPDPFAGVSVHMDYCEAPADETSCEPGRFGERKSVETGSDGSWEADNLQAGYHQVSVDLPDADWDYGAPPGSTEPVRKYFVEVESQSSAVAADGASATSLAAEDDSLDFHLVQRTTPADPVYGVLVLFYNSTRGPIWRVQTNWLTDKPYGEWHGVTTDSDGNVVELVLEGNGLGGHPTPLLDSLVHLKRLDLNSNFFDGIPATYGNFDSLTYLNLSNTSFRGDIPAWIGNLTTLDTLELDFNRLTGSIPTEFGNLTELDYLDISSNRLTGSIPDELGNLTGLKRLYLDQNELSGTIPDTLGTLSSLEVLNLGENKLTGAIPAALGDLASLKTLDLGTNELAGAIPSALTGLDSLTALDLSENKLTSIPSGMDNMSALRWLWLNDNEFTGAIPSGIVDISPLSGVDLSDNGFTGSIPAFDGLDILRLANNSLTGTIPAALGSMTSLYDLQLHGNSLTGTIPTEFGQLDRLQVLRLDDNSLTGNIPAEIGSITTLSDLYVNGNSGMSGTLPSALTNLRRLDWFYTQGTSLCAPTDAAFQTWLKTVNLRRVTNCTP